MENKIELMFDGVLKECVQKEDRNGEYLFEAEDGSFVKFPSEGNLNEMIEAHNEANKEKVEVIPDVVYGEVETIE